MTDPLEFGSTFISSKNCYTLVYRKSYLTVLHRKSLKFAQLPNRCRYLSEDSLNIYFPNNYITPLII